jgi:hypothetical protein
LNAIEKWLELDLLSKIIKTGTFLNFGLGMPKIFMPKSDEIGQETPIEIKC